MGAGNAILQIPKGKGEGMLLVPETHHHIECVQAFAMFLVIFNGELGSVYLQGQLHHK